VLLRRAALIGTLVIVGLMVWFVPGSTPARDPLIVILLGWPLVFGLVPRNWLYGLRTPYTMQSDERWYPQNLITGIALIAWGVVWLVLRLR
jgi:hypothetical protein